MRFKRRLFISTVLGVEVIMTYFEQLHPWCIIRSLPSKECLIVARFRHRDEAIAYLQVLQQRINNTTFALKFGADK